MTKSQPGTFAGLSTKSLAPAGQPPKFYTPHLSWLTRVGSDGSQVQPQREGRPWCRTESQAQNLGRKGFGDQAEGGGRVGRMRGMRWAGQHFPPSSCRGTNGESRTRPTEGPNTEKKAAIWPASGVSGEQASSLADGSYKVQGHSCDCPRPSLGSGSLAHSHPTPGSRAGPHTPGATEAPGSEAEELWAPRVKQGHGSR